MTQVLTPRMEAFAVAMAQGQRQVDAYVAAGYRPNEAGASRLAKKPQVAARVRELREEVTARAVQPLVISKQRVLEELAEIAFVPLGGSLVSVGEKRRALVDLARVAGYLVERQEVGSAGEFADKTDEELLAMVEGRRCPAERRRA